MLRNTPGQFWKVFAFHRISGTPIVGDAAAITARISFDNDTPVDTAVQHPTETENGYYLFPLTQAETDADRLDIYPESTTDLVQVVGSPSVYHPAPSPNGGVLQGPNTVGITTQDQDDESPLAGVSVRLYRIGQAGTQPTGLDGRTQFKLVSGNWDVLATADGYWPLSKTILVEGDKEVTLDLLQLTTPPPGGPGVCNVLIRLRDQHKRPVPGAAVSAKLTSRQSFVQSSLVIDRAITDVTDENGEAVLPLIRGSEFTVGTGQYRIEVSFQGRNYRFTYTTPDQESAVATIRV